MDTVTLLLLTIAIIEGFVGVLQLFQMVATKVGIARLWGFINDFNVPEHRISLFSEIAHGVMKAASERAGAVKGAASRQAESALTSDVSGLALSGLASFLPKKYQAFAPLIAPYIQQFLGQMGNGQAGIALPQAGSSSGQPP